MGRRHFSILIACLQCVEKKIAVFIIEYIQRLTVMMQYAWRPLTHEPLRQQIVDVFVQFHLLSSRLLSNCPRHSFCKITFCVIKADGVFFVQILPQKVAEIVCFLRAADVFEQRDESVQRVQSFFIAREKICNRVFLAVKLVEKRRPCCRMEFNLPMPGKVTHTEAYVLVQKVLVRVRSAALVIAQAVHVNSKCLLARDFCGVVTERGLLFQTKVKIKPHKYQPLQYKLFFFIIFCEFLKIFLLNQSFGLKQRDVRSLSFLLQKLF